MGRDVVFPTKNERIKFEKEVLFPSAGIDASRTDEYYAVQDLMKQLDYATNEVARRLINGEIDESAAVQWLQKYAVMERARAQQRVKFIQRYRSYVINDNLGEDMVRRYIEKRSGTDPEKRWSEFGKLLSSPRLPTDCARGFPRETLVVGEFENFGRGNHIDRDHAEALWSGDATRSVQPASASQRAYRRG